MRTEVRSDKLIQVKNSYNKNDEHFFCKQHNEKEKEKEEMEKRRKNTKYNMT